MSVDFEFDELANVAELRASGEYSGAADVAGAWFQAHPAVIHRAAGLWLTLS